MSDKQIIKYVLSVLGVATGVSLLYYLLTKEGNSKEKEDKIKLDIEKEAEKELKNKMEQEKEKENIEVKPLEDKNKTELLDIILISEVFKRIVNTSIEELFIYKEVLNKDFSKDGQYIGAVPSLSGINKSMFKDNIIHIIANKNYDLVSKSCKPELYNKSLQYYIDTKK